MNKYEPAIRHLSLAKAIKVFNKIARDEDCCALLDMDDPEDITAVCESITYNGCTLSTMALFVEQAKAMMEVSDDSMVLCVGDPWRCRLYPSTEQGAQDMLLAYIEDSDPDEVAEVLQTYGVRL